MIHLILKSEMSCWITRHNHQHNMSTGLSAEEIAKLPPRRLRPGKMVINTIFCIFCDICTSKKTEGLVAIVFKSTDNNDVKGNARPFSTENKANPVRTFFHFIVKTNRRQFSMVYFNKSTWQ